MITRKIACLLIVSTLVLSYAGSTIITNTSALETSAIQVNSDLEFDKENWWFTNLELLSDSGSSESATPSVVIDSDDNIHVVWSDVTNNYLGSGGDMDIFYKYFDSTAETWSVDELVSAESIGSYYYPNIDIDNHGDAHVTWTDNSAYLGSGSDYDIFYKSRSSIGIWSTTEVLTTTSTGEAAFSETKVDSEDNVHVVYEDDTDILTAGTDKDIFHVMYNYTTSTWTTTSLVSSECTLDSVGPDIAVNPLSGDIYIAWTDASDVLSSDADYDIFCKSFDSISSTFDSLILITEESSGNSYSPDIEFSSRGVLNVVWFDYTDMLGAGSDSDIFYKYQDSSSNEWKGIEFLSTESTGNPSSPDCVIDAEDRIYVTYVDNSDILGAGTDWDAFYKYKDPSSAIWSDVQVVSTESTNWVEYPVVKADSQGYISCIWSDYDDLLSSGIDKDIFYKKFVGKPSKPYLSLLLPNPSTDGNVTISWLNNPHISSYSLYRSASPFTYAAIGSMIPLSIQSSNAYIDLLNETGTYYYGVIAHNEYGGSDLSNLEYVQIIEDNAGGTEFFGFLSSLSLWEILTIVGVIILSQVLISLLISSIVKGGNKGSKGKSKGKKKK